jgi:Mn2+/Fe2+ NRAMP family transporter
MTTRKVGLFALVVAIVADTAHNVARLVFAVVVVRHQRRTGAHCRPHWASLFFFFFVVWLGQRMRPDRVNLFDFLVVFIVCVVFVVFVVVLDPKASLVRWDGLHEIRPEPVSVGGGLSVKVALFL